MSFDIAKSKKRISDLRDRDGIGPFTLDDLLNDFEAALSLIPQPNSTTIPSESFTITPCFKLSLNHNGEYHEEYFDTEVEAFAAAAKAAAAL